jgi:hypothetical protein
MSFLQGFAEAATDKWEKEAETEQKKEAWKFQTDYRIGQEHIANEKKTDIKNKQTISQAKTIAKMAGQGREHVSIIVDLLNAGQSNSEIIEAYQKGTFKIDPNTSVDVTPQDNAAVTRKAVSRGLGIMEALDGEKALTETARNAGIDKNKLRGSITGSTSAELQGNLKWHYVANNDSALQEKIDKLPADEEKLRIMATMHKGNPLGDYINGILDDLDSPLKVANGLVVLTGKDADGKTTKTYGEVKTGPSGEQEFFLEGSDEGTLVSALESTITSRSDNLSEKQINHLTKLFKPYHEQVASTRRFADLAAQATELVESSEGGGALRGVNAIADAAQSLGASVGYAADTMLGSRSEVATYIDKLLEAANVKEFDTAGYKKLLQLNMDLAYAGLKSNGQFGSKVSVSELNSTMKNIFHNKQEHFGTHLQSRLMGMMENIEVNRQQILTDNGVLIDSSTQHRLYRDKNALEQLLKFSSLNSERGARTNAFITAAGRNKFSVKKDKDKDSNLQVSQVDTSRVTESDLELAKKNRGDPTYEAAFLKEYGFTIDQVLIGEVKEMPEGTTSEDILKHPPGTRFSLVDPETNLRAVYEWDGKEIKPVPEEDTNNNETRSE